MIRWKRDLLGHGSRIYDAYVKDMKAGVASNSKGVTDAIMVSYAAAALLLYVDLEMPGLEDASSYRLAEQIEALARTIRGLLGALEKAAEELDSLAANRSAGRQPRLAGEDYWSLRNYRMGSDLKKLAEARGITPYDSAQVIGTRDWKAKIRRAIHRGKEFEDKEYPRAAAIFANKENPNVRAKARDAHRLYTRNGCAYELDVDWGALAREIRVGAILTERGHEVASAYLQLGSCLERDMPLLP